ncbi:MAG TPA: aminotransferase class I/II-fold pyridoxal phosphate-dependent enzyme [Bacteroidales bacterium]|nr:aminotransferase class I/II-fold pyridoxal phosphate-dependent enzyme [Bacteroidales bacterium]HOK74335.1 aminotransferase class I/II-fold pyridoxal phosphate-dependent enzyme [Bacteroidales bacterium]HOM39859.1 aminotransferase class I/II-fold pyridoxal phosphate-dependent enzyme [Bacteroidales bacterium]HPP92800.1 aminotransferase class I/II-fold pyridoxal phosphate-dependent enzyme [Bacteroidales bacterium]HRR15709.1 aminotransferase class I/II-fold pyridoxal phosphate-dependent enzyme [B
MKVKPAERTNSVGEYYFSAKLRQIDQMRRAGIDVINLGIGSPDLPPPPEAIKKLSEEAALPGVHGYQSYNGLPELRKAMSDWYQKYFGVTLNPENEILPLIGSKEGIMHISMAFVNPGDEVLVPDPGYPSYTSVTRLVGGVVRTYDLLAKNNWMPDINLIESTSLSKVKLMWVNYPHMPTGTKASAILFERLIKFAAKHGILICNDNPYSFILNSEHISILSVDGAKEYALELNSLSKSHNMAGWRVGLVAGDRDYISTVLKVKSNMDSGMFRPLQLAAAEALKRGDDWFEKNNEIYRRRREIANEIMDILGCRYDKEQTGLFLWGQVSENYKNGEELSDKVLEKAHVFITPGFIFGKNGDGYVRISLCSNEEKLKEARERIKNLA